MIKKTIGLLLAVLGTGLVLWYLFIALKPISIAQNDIIAAYQYSTDQPIEVTLEPLETNSFKLRFESFDGSVVNGQITFPDDGAAKHPVLVGVSAMGRNYNRWWIDSYKGRPTLTHVNKLGQAALNSGYALVAIDARYHGSRKDPKRTLRSIMNDMHFFGDKTSYEEMIIDTVKDYRVLLDWLQSQDKIDANNMVMAGYSMGGQVSLLTASLDDRIKRVVSIVPPYLDDKVARVAPNNLISLLDSQQVLLITSDDDENASHSENMLLFEKIPTTAKQHIIFEGGHILPQMYVESVQKWLLEK